MHLLRYKLIDGTIGSIASQDEIDILAKHQELHSRLKEFAVYSEGKGEPVGFYGFGQYRSASVTSKDVKFFKRLDKGELKLRMVYRG